MLSNDIKISIIVPIYKVEKTLEKCINSLINQSLSDIEIILVNDGSPDGCGSICDQYALLDKRIKVIHKENGGLSSARNAGLKIAKGKYIGFVDSDDYVDLDMFKSMYDEIQKTDADVCICSHYIVANHFTKINYLNMDKSVLSKNEIFKKLIYPLIGNDIELNDAIEGFVCRNLYRREIIHNQTFQSEREYFAEDVVFNLTVYQKCEKIAIIDRPLYYYVVNEHSLTNIYREDLWIKLSKLLDYKVEILEEMNVKNELNHRIQNEIVKCLVVSMKNLKKNHQFTQKEITKEINNILKHKYIHQIDIKYWLKTKKIKVIMLVIFVKLNLSGLINKLI